MKSSLIHQFVLAAIVSTIALPGGAEDLDAALEAQKQKAKRRVYSESAIIEDQNLTVPTTPTEQDKELEKKLRAMEEEANRPSAPPMLTPAPAARPVTPAKNWLTPAILSPEQDPANSSDPSQENDWLSKEVERQQRKDSGTAKESEDELVNRLLREKNNPKSPLSEPKKPERSSPATTGLPTVPSSRPSGSPGLPTIPARTEQPTLSPFSPVKPSTVNDNPFRAPSARDKSKEKSQTPDISSGLGEAEPETGSTSPIDLLRKSSPINRKDPFAADPIQGFKSSIWD
jgi:hypothetical protein